MIPRVDANVIPSKRNDLTNRSIELNLTGKYSRDDRPKDESPHLTSGTRYLMHQAQISDAPLSKRSSIPQHDIRLKSN